ncbi:MAG: hypothetical protein NTZ85_12625 [Bacteroidia bacterium]|nr:hypothetical protein [Bacteroidia bacterium]
MNRNDFLTMIENTGPADRHMIGEVSELIHIFPYFQSAYMLLLKGLQNTADVKFENQLRISAMHIADREVLYYLLKKEPVVETKSEPPVKLPEIKEVGSTTDTEQTVIESGKSSEDLINKIEKSDGDGGKDGTDKDHSFLISVEIGDKDSDATILVIDEESGTVEEKITYMDPGFSVSEQTDLLEIDIESAEISDSSEPVVIADQQTYKEPPSARQLQSDLIDKFIVANPKIEPRKEKSDAPNEDILKPFAEERGGFVTETLARIYIKQGYYSRAIDIYEKLSLKFPEKSSYFASQIEKVKELIKK